MRQVFLADTGPLYAAVDPTDHYHLQAQGELAKLQRERLTVGVAYSTLIESYTLVLRRDRTSDGPRLAGRNPKWRGLDKPHPG